MSETLLEAPVILSTWHESAYRRFMDAVDDRYAEIQNRHQVDDDFCRGVFEWFQRDHPALYKKYNASENKVNELWLIGRTDPEAQKEFNAYLRVMRDGACWALERFIDHKKQQEALARAEAEKMGKQEKLL